ncbi:MAG: amino acid ABC transporter substrate-binding protein [Desulfamplus sp.]|nr:amino acid ABC transporter substrate-binding protein [Desulfamplus sp.]
MKISKVKLLLTITAMALFTLLFIILSCTRDEPPVVIGAALTLSGPGLYAGEEVRDGLLLAADEINQQGGINGRKIQIMVRNAVASDNAAQEVFTELERANPLVIISCLSFLSMKLAPIAEEKRRLLVGLVATVPALTQGRDWVYRYWTTAEHEAPPITKLFFDIKNDVDEIDDAKLGIIYMDDAYGSSVFKDMANRCKEKEIEVVPSSFSPDSKDFSANVNAVKDTKAVAVIGFDVHIIRILKALRAVGYKGDIISTTTATLPSVTSIPESNDLHVTAPAIYNKNYPFADKVKKHYEEIYNKPFTQYSANGYDFIYILIGLLEDKPMTQETVKALFEKGFVYSGVFGNIELQKGEKDILFPLFSAQIRNGEIIYK